MCYVCREGDGDCDDSESDDAAYGWIRACRCAGSMMYVHCCCLARWIEASGDYRCAICGSEYLFRRHGPRGSRDDSGIGPSVRDTYGSDSYADSGGGDDGDDDDDDSSDSTNKDDASGGDQASGDGDDSDSTNQDNSSSSSGADSSGADASDSDSAGADEDAGKDPSRGDADHYRGARAEGPVVACQDRNTVVLSLRFVAMLLAVSATCALALIALASASVSVLLGPGTAVSVLCGCVLCNALSLLALVRPGCSIPKVAMFLLFGLLIVLVEAMWRIVKRRMARYDIVLHMYLGLARTTLAVRVFQAMPGFAVVAAAYNDVRAGDIVRVRDGSRAPDDARARTRRFLAAWHPADVGDAHAVPARRVCADVIMSLPLILPPAYYTQLTTGTVP